MSEHPNRMRELRKKAKLSGIEISKKLGISVQYYYDLEKGVKRLNESHISQLADIFNVTIDYLLCRESENNSEIPSNAIIPTNFIKLPILGTIKAGEPIFAEKNIIGYKNIADINIPSSQCFFLKVIGDSMNLSHITENSLVLVRTQNEVKNGEIAVVLVEGEEATIKKFNRKENIVVLEPHSTNPMHTTRIIDTQQNNVEVIGKVIQIFIKL